MHSLCNLVQIGLVGYFIFLVSMSIKSWPNMQPSVRSSNHAAPMLHFLHGNFMSPLVAECAILVKLFSAMSCSSNVLVLQCLFCWQQCKLKSLDCFGQDV